MKESSLRFGGTRKFPPLPHVRLSITHYGYNLLDRSRVAAPGRQDGLDPHENSLQDQTIYFAELRGTWQA